MRPLSARGARPGGAPRRAAGRSGPGPSKLAYRVSRAWAKPRLRAAVLVYLPLMLLALAGWRVAAEDRLRLAVQARIERAIEELAARPEFAVKGVEVAGGRAALRAEVRRRLGPLTGVSSLKLDLQDLRRQVGAIGAVAKADILFDPDGILRVRIVERLPVALWRGRETGLSLIDAEGVVIGPVAARADHPRLPLLLGAGARDHVAEARALLATAPDLRPRIRALARVGERRWDILLEGELTVMLPEERPGAALEGMMALHYGEEILERDLAVIDLRVPERPALRLAPRAAETLILRRAVQQVVGEET